MLTDRDSQLPPYKLVIICGRTPKALGHDDLLKVGQETSWTIGGQDQSGNTRLPSAIAEYHEDTQHLSRVTVGPGS